MKHLTPLSLLVITGLTACSSATSTPSDTIAESIYAITDVAVIDVEQGRVVPSQTVIVVDDRIDKIGRQGKVDLPKDVRIINGHGLYLLPGLVDAHIHYFDAPIFGRVMIANGVLLVRDMGMPNEYILPLRDQLNRGETLGPEMIATGAMLDGVSPIIPTISISVSTSEQGRAAVQADPPLSHSSIVAREYGIPAVLATGNATRHIKDGQTITVDGSAGTVELK